MLLHDLGDRLEMLAAHDGAGRVVRVRENQRLRLFGDGAFQLLRGQAEFIFHLRADGNRHAANHAGQRVVADEARLRDDNLFTRGDQAAQRHIDRLAAADRDEHLGLGLVREAVFPLEEAADLLAQRHQAAVRRVARAALLERRDARLADVPRREEIRLADGKRDHVVHLVCNIEKAADARGLDVPRLFTQVSAVINHKGCSLSRQSRPRPP